MSTVTLTHRGVLTIGGSEAEPFLQKIVTADLDKLDDRTAMPCALLSPQGKVLHDFLVSRTPDGLRIDVSAAFLPDLARRLMMFRLHADVTFAPAPSAVVRAVWNEAAALRDERFPDVAVYRAYDAAEDTAALDDWTTLRIDAGVAELGTDYGPDDLFPHDLGMPASGAVSVRKGCFVGQEVVSRMHHRGTGRRSVAIVTGDGALPAPGSSITANGRPLGTLGGSLGARGLAVVRTDRLAEARESGNPVLADDVVLDVEVRDPARQTAGA